MSYGKNLCDKKNFYRLIQGDCLDVLPKLKRKSIDCIITDPPYSTPVITSYGRKVEKNYGDLSIQRNFFKILKKEYERIIKPDSAVFIFCDSKYYPVLFEVFYDWSTNHLLVWDKRRIGLGTPFRHQYEFIYFLSPDAGLKNLNNRTYSDILKFKPVPTESRLIGSQKPLSLINEFIKAFTIEGDVVLDSFIGSGTTMEACQNLRRSCIGIEINQKYCEIVKKRCFGRRFLDREVTFSFERVEILDEKVGEVNGI